MKKIIKKIFIVLLSIILIAGVIALIVLYAPTREVDCPKNAQTTNQPFTTNVGESKYFRIPSIITLSNGNIVTAMDARWNIPCDGGGLDTIVSVSENSGKDWQYTFANFLGDYGNRYNTFSSSFIDPEMLVASDSTIYLATTFYPSGVSLNSTIYTPVPDKAFDENNHLLLAKGNSKSYNYYLSDFDENGYAEIIDSNKNAVEGFKVDRNLYIYINNKKKGNLFFKNASFKVVPTTYIHLSKSTDGGKTWSDETLINLKKSGETFFGIAPGRGIELSDGTLVLSAYSLTIGDSSTQKSCFIYSKDNGKTWQRSDDLEYENGWSGESQIIELNNGTLRCFFRSGNSKISYCDITKENDEYKWLEPVITDIENCSNCMISAIRYSEDLNGNPIILVSCPSDTESRANGKIFTFIIENDGNMKLINTYDLYNGSFSYSCLTEMANGNIAVLYETENYNIVFEEISIDKLIIE